jgi:AcrR family transcriptional regulator
MVNTEPGADSISSRARRAVRATGATQREFAARIGMDQTTLSKALKGSRKIRPEELSAIARAADVPLAFLKSGGPVPPSLTEAEQANVRARAESLAPEVRRAQIVDAAAHLIARRGLHNVRIADIAVACEMSSAAVHYHFTSKNEALRAALGHYADRLHRRIDDELGDANDPREKLRRLIDIQLPVSDDDIDEWSIWMQSWIEALFQPELREAQVAAFGRWRDSVLELIRECQRADLCRGGDAELMASNFTSLVDGLAIQCLASTTDMTVDRMRDLLRDSFEPHMSLRV